MDNQSRTFSIKINRDWEATVVEGMQIRRRLFSKGTYKVPEDIDERLALSAIRSGAATKTTSKRAAPENKAVDSTDAENK